MYYEMAEEKKWPPDANFLVILIQNNLETVSIFIQKIILKLLQNC
jgi:hypothetical protein